MASYLLIVGPVVLGYPVVYQWGMAALEGDPRSFFEALAVVVETFTSTGYGEDAGRWSSSPMLHLMIASS